MKRSRRILVFAPFVLVLALVVFSPGPVLRATQAVVTTAAWPFLKFGSFVQNKAGSGIRFLTDQRLLRVQNAAMEKQLEELSAGQVKVAELSAENKRLKKLLDFKQAKHGDAVAARIIGYDPSGWTQSFLVDKGAAHEIEVNQAVVCPGGVVGKIAQVGPMTSKVLLLVDRHIRVGAMLENSRDTGILEGLGPKTCRVLYLPQGSIIAVGQRVLTSGLGGIFPKGMVLGKVVEVGLDELQLYQYAKVEPAVNFSKLEEVLILRAPRS